MTDLSIAEVLNRAADLIEPEGAWTQGRFGSREAGCYCAYGAIIQSNRDCGASPSIYCDATRLLSVSLGSNDIADWNDAPERTQAEVVAKLREAAALARESSK